MNVVQFKKRGTSIQNTTTIISPPPQVKAIGIDLGTTNSVVSIYVPGSQQPETLEYDGSHLVPSMFYVEDNGDVVVGVPARNSLDTRPGDVVRGTKRSMGTISQSFFSGDNSYTPEEVATIILKKLASHPVLQGEIQEHGGIWAVVTVPAHFDDAARQATIEAAARAKINVLRIVNEPTAAALAYSMLPDVRETPKETVAVFDFGGGTFDVSIVDRDGLVFNVLSSEGDIFLGGDDIDIAIAQWLLEQVEPKKNPRKVKQDSPLFRKLMWHAEQAKIAFQSIGEFQIDDHTLENGKATLNISILRSTFEEIAATFVQRTLELSERAMHAARRRITQISRILLVGGSTRLSLVHKMLAEYFPNSLIDGRLEPDLAVSWGAALQAAIILGIEPDTILVDVCSHTLGIGVAEDSETLNENFMKVSKKFGLLKRLNDIQLANVLGERIHDFNRELQSMLRVAPIIHRNSPLPARRSEFFSTIYKDQQAVHVVVIQGEKPTVGENRLIGSFFFDLVQPVPPGTRCEVQLTYDINGMVHVLARQLGTENELEAEFDSRTGEVIGWAPVDDDAETPTIVPIKSINRAELNCAPSAERIPDGVTPLFGATPQMQTEVLNGLIARVRRVLSQGENKSLAKKLDSYIRALTTAQQGAKNDEELETLEDEIFTLLDEEQTT